MDWSERTYAKDERVVEYNGDSVSKVAIERGSDRTRFQLFPFLGSAVLIFALLYCSSYLALLWLPGYGAMHVESQLTADYSAWSFLVFQPVDPAIIEEIQRERGLPKQIVADGSFSPMPAATLSLSPAPSDPELFTPQATSDLPPAGGSTSVPTAVRTIPDPASTPQPTQAASPAKTRRPHKTPKPHKTSRPGK